MISGEKGFLFGMLRVNSLILKIILILLIAILIVPSIMLVFPVARYIVGAIIGFFVFELIAKAFGNNVLTYIISAVIIYFLVFKYIFVSASLMMIYIFLGAGFFSVLIWGTARFSKD